MTRSGVDCRGEYERDRANGGTNQRVVEDLMEIVHITEAKDLAPEDQKVCEATKAWFKIDFVPKMSRVLLTVPEFGRPYGRASRRAMADGALTRAQKELIASMVSAINVCEY